MNNETRRTIIQNLQNYFSLILKFKDDNVLALDRCHNIFLIGALLSKKPENILELGIGTAYVTLSLIHAIAYNKKGRLTSVDNFNDWGGQEPEWIDKIKKAGVNVVAPAEEKEFVSNCASDTYDFLISDADHFNSGLWVNEHLRIIQHDGFMFFHDTNLKEEFPNLMLIEKRIKELGLPYYHFTDNSRPDEHCERGWLFAINKK